MYLFRSREYPLDENARNRYQFIIDLRLSTMGTATMTDNDDPLAVLISNDAKATDRKKLAELLSPYVVIDQESKEFSFHPDFHEINGNDLKIEVLLAAAKARGLYFNVPDGLAPAEVISAGLMPVGSAKSSLKNLFDAHKIKKDKEGRYYLPPHRITELVKRLSK